MLFCPLVVIGEVSRCVIGFPQTYLFWKPISPTYLTYRPPPDPTLELEKRDFGGVVVLCSTLY